MKEINLTSNAWLTMLGRLSSKQPSASPRGMKTKEILNGHTISSMINPVVRIPERKLSYRFMAAEAAWILSGKNDVESISKYNKHIAKFSDDGVSFFGAYGPKVKNQIEYVIKKLAEDTDSRQAVINIWRENPPKTKDVPCTISLQFIIRDGILRCIDTMRSSDIWLGWPYDVFNMSCISNYIKLRLKQDHNINVTLGTLCLNAGSQHLYENNFENAEKVLTEYPKDKIDICLDFQTMGIFTIKDPEEFVERLWEIADSKKNKEALEALS